jgi:hypothetical protein
MAAERWRRMRSRTSRMLLEQMPTVGHLHRVWRGLPVGLGIGRGPIPRDDLEAWGQDNSAGPKPGAWEKELAEVHVGILIGLVKDGCFPPSYRPCTHHELCGRTAFDRPSQGKPSFWFTRSAGDAASVIKRVLMRLPSLERRQEGNGQARSDRVGWVGASRSGTRAGGRFRKIFAARHKTTHLKRPCWRTAG